MLARARMTESRLPLTAHGSRPEAVGAYDWGLMALAALMWGSSFLLIAIGVDHLAPAVVAWLRLLFGIAVLVLFRPARRVVPRAHWPRLLVLGVTWVGVPFVLFPIAQQWVDSSLAGVINSALPIFAAVVAALMLSSLPGRAAVVGLSLGFLGVVLVSGPVVSGGAREALGVVLLIAAVLSYAVAVNVALPLQQRIGSLPMVLNMEVVGLAVVTPFALAGIADSDPHPGSLLAAAALGVFGTGLAFAIYTDVLGRIGATRSTVITYFFPVIAIALGALFRDERVTGVMLVGTLLILVGAWVTGRPERRPRVGRSGAP